MFPGDPGSVPDTCLSSASSCACLIAALESPDCFLHDASLDNDVTKESHNKEKPGSLLHSEATHRMFKIYFVLSTFLLGIGLALYCVLRLAQVKRKIIYKYRTTTFPFSFSWTNFPLKRLYPFQLPQPFPYFLLTFTVWDERSCLVSILNLPQGCCPGAGKKGDHGLAWTSILRLSGSIKGQSLSSSWIRDLKQEWSTDQTKPSPPQPTHQHLTWLDLM